MGIARGMNRGKIEIGLPVVMAPNPFEHRQRADINHRFAIAFPMCRPQRDLGLRGAVKPEVLPDNPDSGLVNMEHWGLGSWAFGPVLKGGQSCGGPEKWRGGAAVFGTRLGVVMPSDTLVSDPAWPADGRCPGCPGSIR